MNWVTYSIIATISIGSMILIYKKLLLLGLHPNVLNLGIFLIASLSFLTTVSITKTPIKYSGIILFLILIAGILAFIGNFFYVHALKTAPNPGYVSTIVATQIVFITLLSVLLYKSEFNWMRLLGIFIVFFGLIILILGK